MSSLRTDTDWQRTADRGVDAHQSASLAAIAAVLCFAGALVGAPAAWAAGTLYVTSFESKSEGVHAFAITANGGLRALPNSPFAAGEATGQVAISPDGRQLYVGNWLIEGTVTAFSVANDGSLSLIPGSPFAAAEGTAGLVVSPDGKHLYAANEGVEERSNNVSAYSIASDGSLSTVAGSPFTAGKTTWNVAITPNGRHLYVINGQYNEPQNDISAFSIASDGSLTPVPSSPFTGGEEPSSAAVTPDGKYLYVTNESSHTISAYAIASDGSLSTVPGSPVPAGSSPSDVAVTPDGKYLYVVEDGLPCEVRAFSIAANGSLTPAPGSPFPTHTYKPIDVAVSRDGKHLYVTSWGYVEPRQGAGWLSAFSIAANGSLSTVPGSPFASERALGLATGPDPAPMAAFSATPAPARLSSSFDASGSSDPDGTVASYKWNFGDGHTETTTSPTTTHTYAVAGNYTATLTVTDEAGCSTTQILSGNTLICYGSPLAEISHQVTVATPATLSVSLAGSGAGTLTSSPPGITCPGTCSHVYAAGTQVTLDVTPASGSTFTGWSGGCSGTTSCQVGANSDTAVTATFEEAQTNEGTITPPPNEIPPPLWFPTETSLPPSIQNARQSTSRWREHRQQAHVSRGQTPTGTTFSFSLNEPATVNFTFNQLLSASHNRHNCAVRNHQNIRHNSCMHTVKRGSLSFVGKTGANHIHFTGEISRTNELKPGRYKLTITATSSVGQHSTPVSLTFTIIR